MRPLLGNIDYIISNVILMVAIISNDDNTRNPNQGRQLAGIHMIAFPTAFLFPYAFDLKFTSILQVIYWSTDSLFLLIYVTLKTPKRVYWIYLL